MRTRIENVRKLFGPLDIDGLLVAEGTNMAYLSGFTGGTGDGLVLIGRDQVAVITDDRYEDMYRQSLADAGIELLITRNYWGVAMAAAKRFKISKLGFEASLPFRDFDYLDENFEGVDIVPIPDLIEALREVKEPDEVAKIRHSTQVAVEAFNTLIGQLQVGMTEREVANRLDQLMKEGGADKVSFDTIVAAGSRGALPHGTYTDNAIEDGDLVTIDFGYYVDGYTSDITRTLSFGQPDPNLERVYQVVLAAQEAAIAAVKPGVLAADVDKAARDVIEAAELGAYFNHATGHSIGLSIHEGPVLSKFASNEDVLKENMIVTIEPGVYLKDQGGVRIEDDILVTKDGHENLTAAIPTTLIKVGK
ncbi:M24 family metallopeptidase [Weissella halotolerans]|uniref:X-Pro aminopeptidase n=1 Tax=Weissella halotolerans DSM 20190 TaxID=1123500 RepID=A0A0R2G5J4_9LACO|nr:Xaa-Pro peptidase family protein [Weissella halotolerans]KRN32490.1 X-Pro aminopeptidase [Weissella halotolerans DSM 20190]